MSIAHSLKEVRDPVHGFIYFDDTEMKIVDSAPFQRLRYIRQLALTYLVYPGAEHSRFAHSMGVMEFSTKIFDTLMMKHQSELKWREARLKRNRQLLRLAALLHDTGHAPFSHASEELLPKGVTHEEYSRRFILNEPIAPLINSYGKTLSITAEDVAQFFSSENIDPDVVFLKQIFAGEIDADKLDYLYRDSLFTGVHYGRFDFQRLIQSLCLYKHGETGNYILAIESGGLHALEAMVLARYFMFTQVYFHKVRRAYDHHLQCFLQRHVKTYPKDLKQYLSYDDNFVFHLLREKRNDDDAVRILQRRPYVRAFRTPEHIDEEQLTRFNWLKQDLTKNFPGKFFCDAAEKSPHKFEKINTYVVDSAGTGRSNLVQNESGIIRNLKNIEQHRIFTTREDRPTIEKFCQDFWNDWDPQKKKSKS